MKNILKKYNIEYQDSPKYYVECPKCSEHRKKKGSRSLLVSNDGQYIRFKCLHEGQCEWNKLTRIKVGTSSHVELTNTKVEYSYFPKDFSHPLLESNTHYEYKDSEGRTECYIVRVEGTDEKKKYFYPLCITTELEVLQKLPERKLLYGSERLDPLKKKTVIVVEGEKTADAARKIFTNADVVTWPGGSNGTAKGKWDLLEGRTVVLWPDADEAGKKAMLEISEKINSKNIKIVDTSGLPKGADLADNISKETIQKLWGDAASIITKPDLDTLDALGFLERVKHSKTGLTLGWKELDDEVRLPQSGLVTILGRTSHGKSTILMNMAIQHLLNSDRPVVYYSYEVPAHRMLVKALMILEGIQYNPIPHENEEIYRQKILAGELESWKWLEPKLNNQFYLTDDPADIDKLYQTLDKPCFNDSLIFLDYLQLIPTGGKVARYEKLQKVSNTLRSIANKRNAVVITGSQIVDGETPLQDQAREAKDIEQASELVLRVWNKVVAEARGTYKEQNDPDNKGHKIIVPYYDEVPGNFALHVLKNRNGEPGKKFGFDLVHGVKLEYKTEKTSKKKLKDLDF